MHIVLTYLFIKARNCPIRRITGLTNYIPNACLYLLLFVP